MHRKSDLMLIALLLLLSLLPLLLRYGETSGRLYAEISVDGKILQRVPLVGRQSIPIETPDGHNLLRVEEGGIIVEKADCADKVCMRIGAIRRPGETIACLPHKLLIEIKEGLVPMGKE